MKDEKFTDVTLPCGKQAGIMQAKGKHFFAACGKAKGDYGQLVKQLICELVIIDGKKVTEEEADEMDMKDVNYLSSVINLSMQNPLEL